jgi:hypothetical protein
VLHPRTSEHLIYNCVASKNICRFRVGRPFHVNNDHTSGPSYQNEVGCVRIQLVSHREVDREWLSSDVHHIEVPIGENHEPSFVLRLARDQIAHRAAEERDWFVDLAVPPREIPHRVAENQIRQADLRN